MKDCAVTLLITLFTSCLACGGARAQDANNSELARQVDQVFAAYDRPGTPGCALGVVRDGEFIYSRAYGQGSLESGVPLTTQSIFYLASVSKQFTAASVVLAAEQGHLSLDDDVRKYVPELPAYGRPVTLRQMLHHTSGYRDVLNLLVLSGGNLEDVHSTEELLGLVARQKVLDFDPGEEYEYSNTNYWLMSVVIPRATGKSLAEFAEQHIFKPLGMTHTRFYDDRRLVVPGRVPAYGELPGGGYQVNWSSNFDAVGDGGLLSSVDDLLLWDRNFHANTLGEGALLRELQTRGTLVDGRTIEYALGLEVGTHRGLKIVQHGGAMFGYRTGIVRFPDQNLAVIALCNVATARARDMATRVAEIYLGSALAPEPAASADATDLGALAGTYHSGDSHAVVEVAAAANALSVDGQHFKPATSRRFTSRRDTVEFEPALGKAAAVTVTYADMKPDRFERMSSYAPVAKGLERCVGDYYSEELQARYRFTVHQGRLMLAIGKQAPVALDPVAADEFHGADGKSIVFRPNAAGGVDAFDLYAWGIENIAFSRVTPSAH